MALSLGDKVMGMIARDHCRMIDRANGTMTRLSSRPKGPRETLLCERPTPTLKVKVRKVEREGVSWLRTALVRKTDPDYGKSTAMIARDLAVRNVAIRQSEALRNALKPIAPSAFVPSFERDGVWYEGARVVMTPSTWGLSPDQYRPIY